MSAQLIPSTSDFSNISVTGTTNWSFAGALNIGVTGGGNALSITSDAAITLAAGTVCTIGTISAGFTITESTGVIGVAGRIQKRIVSSSYEATATIACDSTDIYELTAMSGNSTFSVTGTPLNGQTLMIRLKDNGSSRTLTWGSEFASKGATLPTATTAGKKHHVGLMYDNTSSKWECILATVEA